MAEMLLVNPRRRRRRRRRSTGRKRRMSALQRRYFGKRRSAPVRRRRRHRRRSAALGFSAPRRVSRRRRSSRRRHYKVSRVRRNPIMRGFNIGSFLRNDLMPAGVGAIGAIGVDYALTFVTPMLPVSLQSGLGKTAVRIGGAVGVGYLAGMVMGRRFGEQVTAGALVVTLYDLFKGYAGQFLPGLSEYNMGWVSPALALNEYVGNDPIGPMLPGLSEYVGEYEPGGQYAYSA